MITSEEMIRDTKKIVNYCRRLMLALTMVINILRKRKLSAQESCYFREKIRNTSLKLLYSTAELETKHDLHDWRLALPSSLPRCKYRAIKENLSTIKDFNELLSSNSCSVQERPFFEWKHRISFNVLLQELCGGDADDVELLNGALEEALLVFETARLSAASTANIKETRILIDEVMVMYMRHKEKTCSGMQNLVTWILSAVSLPNLAKQMCSDSALDRFLANGGMVLYVVAILATVFVFLFRAKKKKKKSKVWRKVANIGLVCVVYAMLFSVAFYIPASHRWLISLPCGVLVPAFCVALQR